MRNLRNPLLPVFNRSFPNLRQIPSENRRSRRDPGLGGVSLPRCKTSEEVSGFVYFQCLLSVSSQSTCTLSSNLILTGLRYFCLFYYEMKNFPVILYRIRVIKRFYNKNVNG